MHAGYCGHVRRPELLLSVRGFVVVVLHTNPVPSQWRRLDLVVVPLLRRGSLLEHGREEYHERCPCSAVTSDGSRTDRAIANIQDYFLALDWRLREGLVTSFRCLR